MEGTKKDEKIRHYDYTVDTIDLKMLHEYTGINFSDLIDLDVLTYRKLLKDAAIYALEQTDEGKDYLEECWILKQTKPDYKKLKEKQTHA